MLELASRRGFRECAQHHVSAPGNHGNVEGAGVLNSLGSNAGLSEGSEPHSGNRTGPRFFGVQGNQASQGKRRPTQGASRHHGRHLVLRRTHNSLVEYRLSAVTFLGHEAISQAVPSHFQSNGLRSSAGAGSSNWAITSRSPATAGPAFIQ